MKTRSNPVIAASLLVFFCLPVLFCSAAASVSFVAGTPAGWDFNGAMGSSVLLQTIYGSAQDANGTITANTTRALSQNKGEAMAFTVPQNAILDKGFFKLTNVKVSCTLRVRLFNVTGKGYLAYNHTGITKADPGSGNPALIDISQLTGSSVPSHSEGTQVVTDLFVDFGQLAVTSGDYFITFDAAAGSNTLGSMVRGIATDITNMTAYPDGTPLPKRATVSTSSSVTGNTYHYELSATSDTTYTPRTYLTAFQITTTILNNPPVVNAGPDQTIIAPVDSVNLAGTATDDGVPNPPGALTTTWSKVSGPGDVTFGNTGALNTTATFSAIGMYVLRLTASDGALNTYDEITVIYKQNLPPAVNAGLDQTTGMDDATYLNGTVTDDGLPNPPGAITTWWTQQSGPGTATFGYAGAVHTTVSFSDIGDYVLRLTADDSNLSSYDDVAITCVAGTLNNPPVVNAGTDQEIILPASAILSGTVTDDGRPNPPHAVTTQWTVQTGPGAVTFGNPNAVNTTAGFWKDGTYVLRLTASDGSLSSYDEVTITVYPKGPALNYLKMSINFHTTNSDGQNSLAEMMTKYCYYSTEIRDIACVTDANYISDGDMYSTSTFLGVNGVEATGRGPYVIGLGMSSPPGSYNPGPDTLQGHIDTIIAGGGLPIVAHPQWSHDSQSYDMPTLLANMTNCNLIAVYSHYRQAMWGNGNSEAYWDQLLSSGKVIWGIAEEGSYGWGNKCGFAVTMVDANALNVDAIKSALTNGRSYFYVSNDRWKPHMTLASYAVSGTTSGSAITVSTAGGVGAVTIKFIGNNGTILKTISGSSGSYTITGTENYVRIKINDSSVPATPARLPTTIWTQPVFVTP